MLVKDLVSAKRASLNRQLMDLRGVTLSYGSRSRAQEQSLMESQNAGRGSRRPHLYLRGEFDRDAIPGTKCLALSRNDADDLLSVYLLLNEAGLIS